MALTRFTYLQEFLLLVQLLVQIPHPCRQRIALGCQVADAFAIDSILGSQRRELGLGSLETCLGLATAAKGLGEIEAELGCAFGRGRGIGLAGRWGFR